MIRRSLVLIPTLLFCLAPALSQENAAQDLENAGNSILSNPRLQNVLRNSKQNPDAALSEIRNADSSAVDDAVRAFQAKTAGIKVDDLKAAAQKAQADGTIERALNKANEVLRAEAPTIAAEMEKPAAEPIVATPSTPVAATPVAEPEVPATRPAPGVAGGAPAPVAMPVAVPEEIPAVARRAVEATPATIGSETGTVVAEGAAEPIAGADPTTPMIPESPLLKGDDIPAPKPLAKKYQPDSHGRYPSADRKHMEILSRDSIMDNAKGVLVFTGNVLIDHPEFEIKCDKLEIQMAEGVGMEGGEKEDTNFKRAIASGGMVEIRRIGVDEKGKKKTQIAIARIADYNGITKDIVLSGGPPYIQDGDRFVKTNSEDAKIIMRGNGLYEITGTTNRSQIVIPIENKGGADKKKGDPLDGGIGNFTDRFR